MVAGSVVWSARGDWRLDPAASSQRDRWKRASRGVIVRVVYRLEERGFSMAQCAQVWDQPIGARWFAQIVQLGVREGIRTVDALVQIASVHRRALDPTIARMLARLAAGGARRFMAEAAQ